jgi:hemerythrin
MDQMIENETKEIAFAWTDAFLLGLPQMDATHREFVGLVNRLLTVDDQDFAGCLDRFAEHTEQHFEEEREWMESTAFPPRDCHIGEHQAVLKSVHEVQEYLRQGGDVDNGRRLARELTNWFPGHADYMDAALAQWISKQRTGGAPVVIRRGAQSSSRIPGDESDGQH